jgi:hypothetical protein
VGVGVGSLSYLGFFYLASALLLSSTLSLGLLLWSSKRAQCRRGCCGVVGALSSRVRLSDSAAWVWVASALLSSSAPVLSITSALESFSGCLWHQPRGHVPRLLLLVLGQRPSLERRPLPQLLALEQQHHERARCRRCGVVSALSSRTLIVELLLALPRARAWALCRWGAWGRTSRST